MVLNQYDIIMLQPSFEKNRFSNVNESKKNEKMTQIFTYLINM